jgi:hypothetical protein
MRGMLAVFFRRRATRRFGVALALLPCALPLAACQGSIGDDEAAKPSNGTSTGSGGTGDRPADLSVASASVARRLTRTELDNTVRDLLGDATGPAAKFLAEDEYKPFDNDYTAQTASSALVDSIEAFAEAASARAMTAQNRSSIVPCTPTGADDAVCLRKTIEQMGRRIFRRPLGEQEIGAYLALQSFATENNALVAHDFYTAVELVLRSMLQDPEFLYRIEVGKPTAQPGIFALDGHEIATRVSYLLWGSTPDEELLTQGDSGRLADPVVRRGEAERLIADARAHEQLHRFHAMWLGYRAIPHPPALVAAFNLETTKLIDRVVYDEPQSYLNLFLSPQTYLNDVLADQYALPHPTGGEGWVDYGQSGRAGILSHGSVLAAFSKFSDTSPTQRGIFVQTRLLCNTVSPPPANVNVDQPPGGSNLVCKVDRYGAHRASSSCGACHNQLDPVGFGLENYDIGGRFRTHDDGHPECPIDGAGDLPGYGTFRGPAELAAKLVGAKALEQCMVSQFYAYAVGREVRPNETGAVAELTQAFQKSGYALTRLLADYVASERFVLRAEEVAP